MQWLRRWVHFFVVVTLLVAPQVELKLSPEICLAPTSAVGKFPSDPISQELFLPLLSDQPGVSAGFFDKLPLLKNSKPIFDLTEGEEKTLKMIEEAFSRETKEVAPENDFYLVYIDVNNLKLRNWIYTNEVMDEVLADFNKMLSRIAQQTGGFAYLKGGDERVVVLPTRDSDKVQEILFQIQTYLRREVKQKYKLAVLQLDGDSRIITRGKEHPKNDEVRRLLFKEEAVDEEFSNQDPGILPFLEKKGIRWVRHSEQYFLIYKDEYRLDKEVFLELQKIYSDHFIDFKPHAYHMGLLDTPTITAVGSSLAETIKDMNAKIKKTPATILQQWVLRNEIASQKLAEEGKDAVALIHPEARPLQWNQFRNEDKMAVLNNEQTIRESSEKRSRHFVFGQADGRFLRMPKKRVAIQNTIAQVETAGYLVKVDIGYLSEKIKRKILDCENAIRGKILSKSPTLNLDDEKDVRSLEESVRNELFRQFRIISSHIMGANTKFLNDVLSHGGTDDLISAILTYAWQEVEALSSKDWEAPVFIFRAPPDSIVLWCPIETGNGLNEKVEIKKLEAMVKKVLINVRKQTSNATRLPEEEDSHIDLNFLVSVLPVKDTETSKLIPRGDQRKAAKWFESMERAYRVLKESVVKENAQTLDALWVKKGGVSGREKPEILDAIRSEFNETVSEGLKQIESSYSNVSFENLSENKFLSKGIFFLVYNGNIEDQSERLQVELSISSGEEVLRRDLTEKVEKWKREIALARQTNNPNFYELFYILISLLEREKELKRFEEIAKKLGIKRGAAEDAPSLNASMLFKELEEKLKMFMQMDPSLKIGLTALERLTTKEVFDPDKIYDRLEIERKKMEEKLFFLTGIYLDREKGARVPAKGESVVIHQAYQEAEMEKDGVVEAEGKSKVQEVLRDKEKKEEWLKLRQEYRHLLQFTRNRNFFKRLVVLYQGLLNDMNVPHAEHLIEDLSKENPLLWHRLVKIFSQEQKGKLLRPFSVDQLGLLSELFEKFNQNHNMIELLHFSVKAPVEIAI